RHGYGKIVLPQMDAVCVKREREITPIVDDEERSMVTGQSPQRERPFIGLLHGRFLVKILKKPRPAREGQRHQVGQRLSARGPGVQDDIETGEGVHDVWVGRRRSRNPVWMRPFWNSASAKMRLWSGIVVLMPSITNSSSARRMRALASSRL